MSEGYKFSGFEVPEQNWFKTPNALIDALPVIETVAEMKVVFYILRHTWGYREYDTPKAITTDEFMNGRKRKDGTRIDSGTGLSKPSVIEGLRKAQAHGFITSVKDETDAARIEKAYILVIVDETQVSKDLTSDVKSFDIGGKKSLHRSEKDTIEETPKKEPRKRVALLWSNYRVNSERPLTSAIVYAYLQAAQPADWEKNALEKTAGKMHHISPELVRDYVCFNREKGYTPSLKEVANKAVAWHEHRAKSKPAPVPTNGTTAAPELKPIIPDVMDGHINLPVQQYESEF